MTQKGPGAQAGSLLSESVPVLRLAPFSGEANSWLGAHTCTLRTQGGMPPPDKVSPKCPKPDDPAALPGAPHLATSILPPCDPEGKSCGVQCPALYSR